MIDVGKTETALQNSADKRKVKAKEVERKRVNETRTDGKPSTAAFGE